MAESEQAPLVARTRAFPAAADAILDLPSCRCWRFRTSLTAALGEAIVYGQRISVPIALVVMQAELDWTKETQGVVMTGFWVGYAAMQIPGGWLTTRWGPRRVVGAGLCTSSVLHLCMPMAAMTSPAAMTALRVLQGVSQGVMVPGYAVLWSTWAPPAERSRLSSIPQIGGYAGTIVQLAIAGWQIDVKRATPAQGGPVWFFLGGWEAVFLLNSVMGLAWMVLWFAVVYDTPAQNPRCSAAERAYIEHALAEEAAAARTKAAGASHKPRNGDEPIEHSAWSCSLYKRMSKSKPVLAICAASFCHNIGGYMMIDGFPAYVRDVTGASMTSAGLASAVPQIAIALLTTLGAVAADYLRGPQGPGLSTRTVRRLMHTVATSCNAVLLLLVGMGALDGISEGLIVAVLSCAVGVAGPTVGGGFGVNHLDILPTAAGLLLGVVNMFGSVAGALAPYIMARLTEYPEGTSREQWEQLGREPSPTWLLEVKEGWASVFVLAFWMDILGIIVYGTFSSGERQPWSPHATSLTAQRREGGGQDASE